MRLSDFIRRNMEPILQEWEDFARSLGAISSSMDDAALRDHAQQMLSAIAADLETDQSNAQQHAKALGHAPERSPLLPESAATSHGSLRATDGFTLDQMVSEYRALRASVLRLWAQEQLQRDEPVSAEEGYDQQIRFHEAVDEALADSIHTFSYAVDQMFAAKARRRMEALGTLAAGLGHDMTNVLLPMRMCMDTLTSECSNEKTAPSVEALRSAIAHLTGLTKGLRALSMDPDDAAIAPESTVLNEWWATAVSPFTWALPRGVRLHVQGLAPSDPALPAVRVPAHVLMQAIYNLVQNAAQAHGQRNLENASIPGATPKGNIWISADLVPADADVPGSADKVRMVVRDDGPGMDPTTAQRCTDAFFTTKSRQRGSGLGLYVLRSAVERHGGKLMVQSKLGEGTIFTLLLPISSAERITSLVSKATLR